MRVRMGGNGENQVGASPFLMPHLEAPGVGVRVRWAPRTELGGTQKREVHSGSLLGREIPKEGRL